MEAHATSQATMTAAPRERLDRWLHVIYFRSAGIHHFILRRLRPAGAVLGVVLVLATCLGIGHSRASIYQFFSLSVVLACIGLPWAMLRRARLEAVREVPRHATAGVPLRVRVRVRNLGRHTIGRAWLLETPPDPRPPREDFITLREPGEEERNRFDRTLAYFRWQWLMLGNRLFSGGCSHEEIRLKPGQQTRVSLELTPLRRGVVRLHDLRVTLPDPLGLFQKCVKVKAPPATMLVLPRRYPLPAVSLPGGAAFKISGETNTNAIGTSGEFVGLRDYRPGDPLRQIHWKSWARIGQPIVKELEDTFYPRYGLVLDTLSTGRDDRSFEEAVSVAASFAAEIDTNESLLDLMFVKNEAHIVTAGRGVERAEKLLEVLAGVTPCRSGDLKALAALVLQHRDDLTSCVVVLNGWDEVRAELLRQLDLGGVACVPIIIGHGTRPAGAPGHWLQSGHIAGDLMRLPEKL
jgi:uncharacterized protein (DUF58 family)